MALGHSQFEEFLIRRIRLVTHLYIIIVTNIVSTGRPSLTTLSLIRSEHNVGETNDYRRLHHCLSRYIPTWVFTEYDLLGLFLSWVPSPQRISVLLPTLVLDALHILKEYRMPDDYPILPFFLPKWRQECCVYHFLSIEEDMPKYPLSRYLSKFLSNWELVITPS